MSKIRVLVGTKKGAFILTSDGNTQKMGRQRPLVRAAGNSITSRDRPLILIACMPRRPAVGSGRSSNAQTTAAKHGINPAHLRANRPPPRMACPRERAINLSMIRRLHPGSPSRRTSGTTARSTHGSSSESGIWNRRRTILIPSMQAWKTRPCFVQPMGADVAGTCRPAQRERPALATRRRRDVSAHDYAE